MKAPIVILECPCCKHQGLARIIARLPEGYDDPNHPISTVRLGDALIHTIDISWNKCKPPQDKEGE